MPSSRPWVRVEDILENASAVLEYTQGMSHDDYLADRKTVDACERCLSRISEAAVKLGSFAEERLPGHNWIGIRNIGNILRHEYDQLEAPTIWDVITIHLPPLIADARALLANERPAES
ncbi:HepT-like ribonuclease domain-containing protein [Rhizobium sp. RU36D]|uniref:HepT-like ribonuclease domain-containing protein n=1 Tax=Rhizobium sp. RU36D TaxID=1907415 RepID=UPI001FCDF67B|nr:HepT-like ribonuclease domain-containing protein [Rhizobium sp. RU36D]